MLADAARKRAGVNGSATILATKSSPAMPTVMCGLKLRPLDLVAKSFT